MSDVVVAHAVVDPRAMVVLLRHTAVASSAVLGSKRFANHALEAEVLLVKFPQREELLDDRSLLVSRGEFRDPPGIFEHGEEVEVSCRGVNCDKGDRGQ